MGCKIILLLSAILACSGLGSAIKCYSCGGSQTSDCAKGKVSAMSVVNCKAPGESRSSIYTYFNAANSGESDDDEKPVCLQLVETGYEPNLYVRGCGLFPSNLDACQYLKDNANVVTCKSCKTDNCNHRAKSPAESLF